MVWDLGQWGRGRKLAAVSSLWEASTFGAKPGKTVVGEDPSGCWCWSVEKKRRKQNTKTHQLPTGLQNEPGKLCLPKAELVKEQAQSKKRKPRLPLHTSGWRLPGSGTVSRWEHTSSVPKEGLGGTAQPPPWWATWQKQVHLTTMKLRLLILHAEEIIDLSEGGSCCSKQYLHTKKPKIWGLTQTAGVQMGHLETPCLCLDEKLTGFRGTFLPGNSYRWWSGRVHFDHIWTTKENKGGNSYVVWN